MDAYNWSNTDTGRIEVSKIGKNNNLDVYLTNLDRSGFSSQAAEIKEEIAQKEAEGWTEWYIQMVPDGSGGSETQFIGVTR